MSEEVVNVENVEKVDEKVKELNSANADIIEKAKDNIKKNQEEKRINEAENAIQAAEGVSAYNLVVGRRDRKLAESRMTYIKATGSGDGTLGQYKNGKITNLERIELEKKAKAEWDARNKEINAQFNKEVKEGNAAYGHYFKETTTYWYD